MFGGNWGLVESLKPVGPGAQDHGDGVNDSGDAV